LRGTCEPALVYLLLMSLVASRRWASRLRANQVGRKEGRKVRQIALIVTGLYTGLHGDYTDHRGEGADR
jgi:hypothetical protein